MTLPTDPVEAVTDTVRVCVVLDTRRSRIHTITGDDAEAQRTVRDLAAKGLYPLAATMTVGLVTPDAASRKRIEAVMVAEGWESPADVALLHAIKDQFAAQARDARAETAALRAVLADVADLCRPTRADDVLRLTDTERLQRIAGRIQAGEPDAR